jgi:hypothetical protein
LNVRVLAIGRMRLWLAVILLLVGIVGTRRATAQASSGVPPIRTEWWGGRERIGRRSDRYARELLFAPAVLRRRFHE